MLSFPDRLKVAAPNCVADDFGGEIVALNLDTGFYFSLRDLAGAIWRDLAAGHAVEGVVAVAASADPLLGRQAARLVEEILNQGLMVPDEAGAAPAGPLSSSELIAGGTTSMILEIYDDLREMVMSDPIHDVDEEMGWPVRRMDA